MSKDLQGMKSQAEGLTKEYDRILEENGKLQVWNFNFSLFGKMLS